MAQRLIISVCQADKILKSGLINGNFNILAQVQPKRLEVGQFLSQVSAHPFSNPPKGFDKPFGSKEGNKSATFTANDIETGSKSSSLPVYSGGDGQGGDKEKSSSGSGGKKITRILVAISTAGILGACGWVYFKKNYKGFNVVDVVDK